MSRRRRMTNLVEIAVDVGVLAASFRPTHLGSSLIDAADRRYVIEHTTSCRDIDERCKCASRRRRANNGDSRSSVGTSRQTKQVGLVLAPSKSRRDVTQPSEHHYVV